MLTARGEPDLVVLSAKAYEALMRYQPTAAYADELDAAELALIAAQRPGSGPTAYPDVDGTPE